MARANQNRRAFSDIGNVQPADQPRIAQKPNPLQNQVKSFVPVVDRDRPITRQYGANLALKLQSKSELIKPKQRKTTAKSKEIKDHDLDIHEDKEEEEEDVLMEDHDELDEKLTKHKNLTVLDEVYTETSESLIMETHVMELCEVEMEEAESPVLNIDESDARNPLAVVEYIDEIYAYHRKTEKHSCVPSDYMSRQTDINHRMRAILVDWLIEVHHKFDLLHETLFLAINIIDRYLSITNVMRKSLQLVGITGMLLACKYEEIFVPTLDDFVNISDKAYSKDDVLRMEKSMVSKLEFKLSFPTPLMFMKRFLKAAESDVKLEIVSFYLMDLCLVDYRMLEFKPSLLSASAICAARCMLGQTEWTKSLKFHTTYNEGDLKECMELIEEIHGSAGTGKLTSVYRKYSDKKYNSLAKQMNPLLQNK